MCYIWGDQGWLLTAHWTWNWFHLLIGTEDLIAPLIERRWQKKMPNSNSKSFTLVCRWDFKRGFLFFISDLSQTHSNPPVSASHYRYELYLYSTLTFLYVNILQAKVHRRKSALSYPGLCCSQLEGIFTPPPPLTYGHWQCLEAILFAITKGQGSSHAE